MKDKQLTLPPNVAPLETRLIITHQDRDGFDIESMIYAGWERDGGKLTVFSRYEDLGSLSEERQEKVYRASDGDFENPLILAIWTLMGVQD